MAVIPPKPPWIKDDPDARDADVTSAQPPTRDAKGRFVPGISGNPSGRPRSRIRQAATESIEDVIAVVKAAALAGDMAAAGALLRLTVPPLRPESDLVEFEFDPNATVVDKCNQVLAACAAGKLTLDQAERFIALLGKHEEVSKWQVALDELDKLKRKRKQGKPAENMPAGHVMPVDWKELPTPAKPS